MWSQACNGIITSGLLLTVKARSHEVFSTTILFLRLLQLAANKLVQALRDHPVYKLRIIGYADSRGNEEYNQAPSERRAEAVKRYFID